MAGSTFSAISTGTLTRTVSPLSSVLSTRTWIHCSLALEEVPEVLCANETGARKTAAKATVAANSKTPRDMRFMLKLLGHKYAQGTRKVPRDAEKCSNKVNRLRRRRRSLLSEGMR